MDRVEAKSSLFFFGNLLVKEEDQIPRKPSSSKFHVEEIACIMCVYLAQHGDKPPNHHYVGPVPSY